MNPVTDPFNAWDTSYLEVGDPVGEGFDSRVDACGIFTSNDDTALNGRVQDLYVRVPFAD